MNEKDRDKVRQAREALKAVEDWLLHSSGWRSAWVRGRDLWRHPEVQGGALLPREAAVRIAMGESELENL